MPITSIVSINQLITWFQTFQENHYMLKDFGFGETYDIGTSRQMTFPYMFVTLNDDNNIATGSNIKSAIPDLSFSIMMMDKINIQDNYLDTNGFPSDNSQEIISDCLQYVQDLIVYIQQNWGQYGVLISQDTSFYPVIDETPDKATGILARFVLRTRQVNCVIPESPTSIVITPQQAEYATLLTCETLGDCPTFQEYAYTGISYNTGTTELTLTSLNGNTISVTGITGGGGSGTSGTSGTNGTSGTSGGNGTSGTSGGNGTSGTNGTGGSSGTSGTNGNNGSSGTSGGNGTSGTSGANGTSGTNGGNGTSGTNGTSGVNGGNGTSGTNGNNGTSGTNGSSGTNGTSGTSPSVPGSNDQLLTSNGAGAISAESNLTFDGTTLKSPIFHSTQSSGNEGGEFIFALPATGSSLSTSITFDSFNDRIRLFETGGSNRGGFWDISTLLAGVGTNFTRTSQNYTTDGTYNLDASLYAYATWIQSNSATSRQLNISNLANGQTVSCFIRNNNVGNKTYTFRYDGGTFDVTNGLGGIVNSFILPQNNAITLTVYNSGGTIFGSLG